MKKDLYTLAVSQWPLFVDIFNEKYEPAEIFFGPLRWNRFIQQYTRQEYLILVHHIVSLWLRGSM